MSRTGTLTALTLIAAALAAAGIYHVPSGEEQIVIAGRAGSASFELVEPGFHWRMPLLSRIARYPAGPFTADVVVRQAEGRPLASREGSPVRLSVRLSLRPDRSRAGRLAQLPGARVRDADVLSDVVAPAMSELASRHGLEEVLSLGAARGSGLEESIREALASVGLLTESVEGAGFWPEIYEPGEDPAAVEGRRILLVGLDGADWKVLDPLIERGDMPNLGRIVQEGVRARMKALSPMLSPILWTSMATGKVPEKHGIVDFLAVDSRTGREVPVTSTMRKARAFWEILSRRGIPVGTVGWWATWPAERVLGFQVSDRVAYQLFGAHQAGEGLRGRTWPEGLILSLAPEIRQASLRAEEDLVELLGRPADPESEDEAALRQILVSTRTYHHSALRLMREYRPRVAAVYYEGMDTVAHLFMRYAPPRLPGVRPEEVERWGAVVDRFAKIQDRLLGEAVREAGEGVTVMVVSDHGFKSGSSRPQTDPRIGVGMAADWHRKFGVFAVAGPGIRRGGALSDVSILDVSPTILALMGLPAGEDMDGRPVTAILEEGAPEPPDRIASWEGAGEGRTDPLVSGDVSEAVEEEMIAKLAALGYLSQTTPNASNNVGITLLQQGRNAEAEQAFRRALEQDPSFGPARLNVARALMAAGRMDEALAELEAARKADPDLPEVDNLIGNVLLEREDIGRAEATFRRALERDSGNPHLWNSLGITLARQGRSEEALAAYRRVEQIDADYAEAINNAGLVLREQGRLEEAIAEFRRAIAADPDFPGSWNNLGLVEQDRGNLDAALEAYDRGLEADPENAVIWNSRGSALLAMERREEAKRAFEQAIDLDPTYASAHNNLGAVLGLLGDVEGEFEEYLKAIDQKPDYADARLNLSLNLIRRGLLREADRSLRQALEIEPAHARARLELGILLVRQGKEEEGRAELEKARSSNPRWTAPRNALARLHLARGRPGDALREARESLSLDPAQPEIRRLVEEASAATSGSRP